MTGPPPDRRTISEERKAATRAAIIDAAAVLFRDQGVDETAMAQIARRAQVGVGTLYGYFPSKDDLLRHVLRTVSRPYVLRYVDAVSGPTTHLNRIRAALNAYANFLIDNRVLMRSAFVASEHHAIATEFSDPMFEHYCNFIQEGVDDGELEPVPAQTTAGMFITSYTMAFLGLGAWSGRLDPVKAREELDTIVVTLLTRRTR